MCGKTNWRKSFARDFAARSLEVILALLIVATVVAIASEMIHHV